MASKATQSVDDQVICWNGKISVPGSLTVAKYSAIV